MPASPHPYSGRWAVAALAALAVSTTAVPMLPRFLSAPDSAVTAAQRDQEREQSVTTDAVIVDLKDNVSDADIRDIENRIGLDLSFNSIYSHDDKLMRATLPDGANSDAVLSALRDDSRVETAEPEEIFTLPFPERLNAPTEIAPRGYDRFDFRAYGRFTPNDPRYAEQWNFQMIRAENAWQRSTGKGVVVAVIDTGVSAGPSKRGKPCRDFDQTAVTAGYDFVHDDADPYDDHGHGTHVAGTIAESTNNGEGVTGLAFEATIMPLKVLTSQGWGNSADIADAIRFAADKGANVINMSLGSSQPSKVIHDAVKYARKKGVVIVCAAGNGFGSPVGYPAAFPECIAVSSVGPTGQIAKYSSYGKQVALAAPGGDMIDSRDPKDGILQNTYFPEDQGGNGDDYYAFQGTSMASPHVAAAAALIMAQGVKDPAQVRDILAKSAVPGGDKSKYGAGVLNADAATQQAAGYTGPKLRHLVWFALIPCFLIAGGLSIGLRAGMLAMLGIGMFLPDWFTASVGADSAWNLIGFSALIPAVLLLLAGRRFALRRLAAMLALGVGIALFSNWYNGTVPFTTASFGDTALPWTATNMALAFLLPIGQVLRALRRR